MHDYAHAELDDPLRSRRRIGSNMHACGIDGRISPRIIAMGNGKVLHGMHAIIRVGMHNSLKSSRIYLTVRLSRLYR